MFVPVAPVDQSILREVAVHEYPPTNEQIEQISQSTDL